MGLGLPSTHNEPIALNTRNVLFMYLLCSFIDQCEHAGIKLFSTTFQQVKPYLPQN